MCVCFLSEEGGKKEEQSERKPEEKQRVRGPEGQRPLVPSKVRELLRRLTGSLMIRIFHSHWPLLSLLVAQLRSLQRQDLSREARSLSQDLAC